MKRIIDIFFSTLGLIMLLPLLFIISILIISTSNGSVLFIQKRVGKDCKIFKMIKFRTMYIIKDSTSMISVKGDTRVTKLGVFLRRYKLDELPELINVFLGEMSLVGPRPDVTGYADKLVGIDRDILKLRPGITGPASLKYSNEEEILAKRKDPKAYNDKVIYPDKVKINLDYYNNRTIWLDFKIIFATIFRNSY
jgi:lipopolysaccharide/colanic/teichoic acid biosynthesis glycosyltransferase